MRLLCVIPRLFIHVLSSGAEKSEPGAGVSEGDVKALKMRMKEVKYQSWSCCLLNEVKRERH